MTWATVSLCRCVSIWRLRWCAKVAFCLPPFPPLVVLTPWSFVGIFTTLFWPTEEQFRKYIPRQSWPVSDANVLTRLVLLHFGPFHQLINCYGPEPTARREKGTKMAEKCNGAYFFVPFVWTKWSELQMWKHPQADRSPTVQFTPAVLNCHWTDPNGPLVEQECLTSGLNAPGFGSASLNTAGANWDIRFLSLLSVSKRAARFDYIPSFSPGFTAETNDCSKSSQQQPFTHPSYKSPGLCHVDICARRACQKPQCAYGSPTFRPLLPLWWELNCSGWEQLGAARKWESKKEKCVWNGGAGLVWISQTAGLTDVCMWN